MSNAIIDAVDAYHRAACRVTTLPSAQDAYVAACVAMDVGIAQAIEVNKLRIGIVEAANQIAVALKGDLK